MRECRWKWERKDMSLLDPIGETRFAADGRDRSRWPPLLLEIPGGVE